jgi:hypothetical protein
MPQRATIGRRRTVRATGRVRRRGPAGVARRAGVLAATGFAVATLAGCAAPLKLTAAQVAKPVTVPHAVGRAIHNADGTIALTIFGNCGEATQYAAMTRIPAIC